MRLRAGVTVTHAIEVLDGVMSRSTAPLNTLNALSPSSSQYADLAARPAYQDARDGYLSWVSLSQVHLSTVFADTELSGGLMARAYWHICNFSGHVEILARLIREELAYQVGHANLPADTTPSMLGQAASRLRRLSCLADRPGKVCVPDTNSLMHYQRFDQFDWRGRLGVPQVRLVIPVAVVAEIDRKKYARRAEFWDRARDLLALIDSYADGSPDGYAELRAGVTVEIMPDEEGHMRLPDPDQEILDRCQLLHQVTGQLVTLVTGDSAVRISARVIGIEVLKLTREDLLPRYRPELNPDTANETA